MKKYTILLYLTIHCFVAISQSIRVTADHYFYFKSEYGITFRSENAYSYLEIYNYRFPENCEEKVFYLNGFPLPEKDFSMLRISKNEIDSEQCYFTFDYRGDSVIRINYYTTLTIPIFINEKKWSGNSSFSFEDCIEPIIMIKKERRLFKKNRILIWTE